MLQLSCSSWQDLCEYNPWFQHLRFSVLPERDHLLYFFHSCVLLGTMALDIFHVVRNGSLFSESKHKSYPGLSSSLLVSRFSRISWTGKLGRCIWTCWGGANTKPTICTPYSIFLSFCAGLAAGELFHLLLVGKSAPSIVIGESKETQTGHGPSPCLKNSQ